MHLTGPLIIAATLLTAAVAGCATPVPVKASPAIDLFEGTATYRTAGGEVTLTMSMQGTLWKDGHERPAIRTGWSGDLSPFTRHDDVTYLALAGLPCGADGLRYEVRDGIVSYASTSSELPPIHGFVGRPASAPAWDGAQVTTEAGADETRTWLNMGGNAWGFVWVPGVPVPSELTSPNGQTLRLERHDGATQHLSCSAPPPTSEPSMAPWTLDGPTGTLGLDEDFSRAASHARSDPTLPQLLLYHQANPDTSVIAGRATTTTSLDGSPGAYTWIMWFGSHSDPTSIQVTCQEANAAFTCGEQQAADRQAPGSEHADLAPWASSAALLLGAQTGARFEWVDGALVVDFDSAVPAGDGSGKVHIGTVRVNGSTGQLLEGHGHLSVGAMDWTP